MPLFGRQVILQIGREGQQAKSFQGIRIGFDVRMTRSSTPNEAVIEAYNLNAATVALAQADDAVVRLMVGYDTPRLVFTGNPVKNGVRLERQGPDRVLRLELQDGGRAYQSARVNLSFSTQTTLQQVYDAVSEQMGLPSGTIRLEEGVVFPKGISLNGPAREVLDRLAAATDSDWMIRDGVLQFIGTDEDSGEQAVVFSAEAGNLIGSPSPKDDGIEVTALLAPSLRPGKPFRVQSEDYNGDYTAQDVSFRGDSGFAQPFYVVTTGKPRG